MSTFAEKWCAGFGVPGHLADGALHEIRQPVPFMACSECWRRWSRVHDRPDWRSQ